MLSVGLYLRYSFPLVLGSLREPMPSAALVYWDERAYFPQPTTFSLMARA